MFLQGWRHMERLPAASMQMAMFDRHVLAVMSIQGIPFDGSSEPQSPQAKILANSMLHTVLAFFGGRYL